MVIPLLCVRYPLGAWEQHRNPLVVLPVKFYTRWGMSVLCFYKSAFGGKVQEIHELTDS
jgi:hypothetical protein